jgi:hypothetical protein
LRVFIVVVQIGPVKIYVPAVEALKEKEREDGTKFTTKTSSGGAQGKGKTGWSKIYH